MMSLFHAFVYVPIYNLLVFLVGIIPGGDIGLAVIAATIIVRLVIMPLTFAQLRTARASRALAPEMKEIQARYKEDPEKRGRETLALYKKYGINPFAGIFVALLQLPIVLGLYFVFQSHTLATIDTSLLYSFISVPAQISPLFLGIFAVAETSILLAILAAFFQGVQIWYSIPLPPKPAKPGTDMQEDFGRMMALQMRFLLPLFIGIAAFYTSNAIALYFITGAIIGIIQEFIVQRQKFSPPDNTSAPI